MQVAEMLYEEHAGRILLRALPVVLFVLGTFAIAYRYYAAYLAAKVAALDDTRVTPAHRLNDGQNYHPTNRWVLFGHHFAAISGAGPLIGPVLAIQYGYFPGLLWLVIGVCLAGAVQDMLVLAASVRRDGRSLAIIAQAELGRWAALLTSLAILFIVIIALAGLGFVVVKALGGEEVKLPEGMEVILPPGGEFRVSSSLSDEPLAAADFLRRHSRQAGSGLPSELQSASGRQTVIVHCPPGCQVKYSPTSPATLRPETMRLRCELDEKDLELRGDRLVIPARAVQLVPGSSWGMFTIACTIPIALLVSWYMYRLRPGHVFEASLLGALGVVAATVAGAWIPGSALEKYFSLTQGQTVWALCLYGFVASVLPVWMLLCPRDYISSFLKIGTILLLVVGVVAANPVLRHPPLNEKFQHGGPTFEGGVFPFVFICIMCGAISGFHALVSSGTTPKMVDKETHIRPIGYGAMLMEGLVGVMALIAAAALPVDLYYDINTPLDKAPQLAPQLAELYQALGVPSAKDRLHAVGVKDLSHLDLNELESMVGGESLRGRTGGAVTLAVSMALIFTQALAWTAWPVAKVMAYWYHFAIMFEALFILTTIDTGTRIARFLLQEMLGRLHPRFHQTDWLPGAWLATLVVTVSWGSLVATGSISTIWPMFGIANQLLAVVALALVSTWLINQGRSRSAVLTLLPMAFVTVTTLTAGTQLVGRQFPARIKLGYETGNLSMQLTGWLSLCLALVVMIIVSLILLNAAGQWWLVLSGRRPPRSLDQPSAGAGERAS